MKIPFEKSFVAACNAEGISNIAARNSRKEARRYSWVRFADGKFHAVDNVLRCQVPGRIAKDLEKSGALK